MFATGFFSRGGNEEMIRKMKQLSKDAHQIMQDSEELPTAEQVGCSFILAIRDWEISAFDELRRTPNTSRV